MQLEEIIKSLSHGDYKKIFLAHLEAMPISAVGRDFNYGGLEYEYAFSAGFANGNNSQNFSNFDEFSFSDLSVYATVTVDTQPEDWDDSSGWEIDIDDTINEDGVIIT